MMMSSDRPSASELGEAKDADGAAVPQADHTIGVRIDDRIGHAGEETVGKMFRDRLHVRSQRWYIAEFLRIA